MAKSVEVDINVNNNIEGSISQLKALKRELKNTAVGTEEFKKLYNQIDDLEDKIKSAKNVSSDWVDSLEMAGGPVGMLGGALNKAKVATQSWGAALKATGIGLVVAAVGMLVNAFSQSETSMKKLEPLFEALDKTMGGILEVAQPMIDMFIELAIDAMPYVTKALGMFYSALAGLFTYIKTMAMGVGKVWKGIFTLDWTTIVEGVKEMGSSFGKTADTYTAAMDRFDKGYANTTRKEKKNSADRVKNVKDTTDKIIDYELNALREVQGEYEDYLKRLAELQKNYNTEIEELQADTEQKKLDLWYKKRAEEIDAITKDGAVKNELYALLETERAIKQKEIDQKVKDEADKLAKDNAAKQKDIDNKKLEDDQRNLEARLAAQIQFADAVQGVIQGLGALFEQGSAEAKALALLDIAVGTAKGFIQGLDIAQKGAAATGPAAPYAFPLFYAQQIGAVLGAASRAKAILSSGSTSASGSGASGGSVPSVSAPTFNVVGVGGANQIAQSIGQASQAPLKAYVVSSDVTTQQALDRNIVKSATLG
jgi:hypothetical protein